MKKLLIVIAFLGASMNSFSQMRDARYDSLRLENIDNTLKNYGKQNVISDKLTLASIVLVIVGSACNMKPTPMLVSTSLFSLANLIISYKADLHLSKHKSN